MATLQATPGGRCKGHGGGKKCEEPGCSKWAIGGGDFCRAHGKAIYGKAPPLMPVKRCEEMVGHAGSGT